MSWSGWGTEPADYAPTTGTCRAVARPLTGEEKSRKYRPRQARDANSRMDWRTVAMKVFYSDDYVAAGHSFDTTRKARWIAESLSADPIAGVEVVAPEPLTRKHLLEVHDAAYIDAVATGSPCELASSQGFTWDAGLWRAVRALNGGALAAMRDGVAGSLSSGLHHARRGRGAGFCTFNGLVIAAHTALAAGAGAVRILDFDAHCGGGTHELTAGDERIRHADVSVSSYDSYIPAARHRNLQLVDRADRYLSAVAYSLGLMSISADLVLYNAGMDPYEGCSVGGLGGVTEAILAEREEMVFDWARASGAPIAFVLAGGYTSPGLSAEKLVELHRLTIRAAANCVNGVNDARDLAEAEVLRRLGIVQTRRWSRGQLQPSPENDEPPAAIASSMSSRMATISGFDGVCRSLMGIRTHSMPRVPKAAW